MNSTGKLLGQVHPVRHPVGYCPRNAHADERGDRRASQRRGHCEHDLGPGGSDDSRHPAAGKQLVRRQSRKLFSELHSSGLSEVEEFATDHFAEAIADRDRIARLVHAGQPGDVPFSALDDDQGWLDLGMGQGRPRRDGNVVEAAQARGLAHKAGDLRRGDRGASGVEGPLHRASHGADRDAYSAAIGIQRVVSAGRRTDRMDSGAIGGDQAMMGTEVRSVRDVSTAGPVPVNPADPKRMLERQAPGSLQGDGGLEGRASTAAIDPVNGTRPEAQCGAPRLTGEDSGHLGGHGCSRHEKAPHDGGALRRNHPGQIPLGRIVSDVFISASVLAPPASGAFFYRHGGNSYPPHEHEKAPHDGGARGRV